MKNKEKKPQAFEATEINISKVSEQSPIEKINKKYFIWDAQDKTKPVLCVSDKRSSLHPLLLVLLYQNETTPSSSVGDNQGHGEEPDA